MFNWKLTKVADNGTMGGTFLISLALTALGTAFVEMRRAVLYRARKKGSGLTH